MKKVGVVVFAVVCIALVCGGFYFYSQKNQPSREGDGQLTEVQKINTKNIEDDYPSTPREVVKLYNRIVKCYYGEEYTQDEVSKLADQALILFDQELKEANPKDQYLTSILADVASYKNAKKTISQTKVCDSNDIRYFTDSEKGDSLAYVTASYFVQEDKKFSKTFQEYVLRRDESGKWRILCFYKIKGDTSEDGGN